MEKVNTARVHRLNIKLNDFENEELREIAAETHQSVSNFVRIAILEKKERIRMFNENQRSGEKDKTHHQ